MINVYTVITNNFDNLHSAHLPVDAKTEKYVCFTDRPRELWPWHIQPIPPILKDQRRASRIPKMLPHLLMPEADYSIYMDGAFKMQVSPSRAIEDLGDADIGLFSHPTNKSIHDEYNFYIKQHGYVPDDVDHEYKRYVQLGIPITGEFYAGGLIIRRHNKKVEQFNELWMKEYLEGSNNDQFSLYYSILKTGIKVRILGADNLWDSRFGYCLHAHEGGIKNAPYVGENLEWEERIKRIKEICNDVGTSVV